MKAENFYINGMESTLLEYQQVLASLMDNDLPYSLLIVSNNTNKSYTLITEVQ